MEPDKCGLSGDPLRLAGEFNAKPRSHVTEDAPVDVGQVLEKASLQIEAFADVDQAVRVEDGVDTRRRRCVPPDHFATEFIIR